MNVVDWLDRFVALPSEYVKTIGSLAGGALLAVGTYVLARIKEGRRPVADLAPPRLSLDPVDRDLGFTLVRTATDLTRALNDHADAMAALGPPACSAPPAPPVHRATRARRAQP